jgi:uncharacterized protein YcnI
MSRVTAQRCRRTAAAAASSVLLVCAGAGVAAAHVTVHADNPTSGASDVALQFRVPNERDDAGTTKVDVFFPLATPLLDLYVQPHPGWTARTTKQHLAQPVTTDDGSITDAVAEIVWTADTAADALAPGQSADFVVTAGQLPDVSALTFKVLQTYSSGEVARWIELPSSGVPEPESPAPTLTLSKAAGGGSDDQARVLGLLGIVVGAAGGGAAFVMSRRSRAARLYPPFERRAEHAR